MIASVAQERPVISWPITTDTVCFAAACRHAAQALSVLSMIRVAIKSALRPRACVALEMTVVVVIHRVTAPRLIVLRASA